MVGQIRIFIIIFAFIALTACSSLRHRQEQQGNTTAQVELFPGAPAAVDPKAEVLTQVESDKEVDEEENPLTSKIDESKIALKEYPDIPHHYNQRVQRWVDYFQGKGSGHMQRYLERSTKYLPLMKKILRENGMPEDLVYISLIESGFGSSARSHAGAVGYWQFISATGRRYGMQINSLLDERKDPIKSTYAAVRYFRSLYNVFGNWYFAFAAYNGGENRMFRVLMKQDSRDFWNISEKKMLPKETSEYIPKYLAARMIAKEPEKYGFTNLEYSEELAYSEIVASQTVDLQKLAQESGMDFEELKNLNMQFNTQYAPVFDGKSLTIRVPTASAERATVALANAYVTDTRMIAAVKSKEYYKYKVRRGDTLARIARRHRTSISRIRELNGLGSRSSLRVGQMIKVPENTDTKKIINDLRRSLKETRTAKKENQSFKRLKDRKSFYVVRRGDTLLEIAKRHRTSISKIVSANNLRTRDTLFVGKRLVIPD